MRANERLKTNIDTLLRRRGQSRKDLAQWCYRTESWISKIFRESKREIPLKYLDRIADFFGLATYQLFQPGIDPLTERRRRVRRAGQERRLAHDLKIADEVRSEVHRTHPREADSVEVARMRQALIRLSMELVEIAGSAMPDTDTKLHKRARKKG